VKTTVGGPKCCRCVNRIGVSVVKWVKQLKAKSKRGIDEDTPDQILGEMATLKCAPSQ
jgi:hypothetical protein